jgi:drug/metabolite transporter (DMT)-like permease
VDKQGISLVHPVFYLSGLYLGTSVGLLSILRPWSRPGLLISEWRQNRLPIVAVAALGPLGYGLVLTALTFSPLSYVGPAREISVVVAAVLGAVVLHEGFGPPRIIGSLLIVAGVLMLAADRAILESLQHLQSGRADPLSVLAGL